MSKDNKTYMIPNPLMPGIIAEFDPEICNGCNSCVDACSMDVFMPNPEKGKPPITVYPDECWCCGCCVSACPYPEAINLQIPLNRKVIIHWKRKDTGETYRLGMKNPPSPNTKPPVG